MGNLAISRYLLCCFLILVSSSTVLAGDLPGPAPVELASSDGSSTVRLRGRFMIDSDFYDGAYSALPDDWSSETEFRRARFGVDGRIEDEWLYMLVFNIDDQQQSATIDTAYAEYIGLESMDVSFGRFKRPVGLEALTSSNLISTVERALIFDVVPNNNTADFGLMLDGELGGGLHWYAGVFDGGLEERETKQDEYGLYGRLVWSRLAEQNGVWHLAASAAGQLIRGSTETTVASRLGVSSLPADTFQFANRLNPQRQLTADILVDQDSQLGLEFARIAGSWTLQSEVMARQLELPDGDQLLVSGGYVQLAYVIGGQQRGYQRDSGALGPVLPVAGRQAWELVAKLDYVQADYDRRFDNELYAAVGTVGLNWMPNKRLRFMLNYLKMDSANLLSGNNFNDQGAAITSRIQFFF